MSNINIIKFINSNFGDKNNLYEIEAEIDSFLQSIEDETVPCSYPYIKTRNITAVGLNFYGNFDQNSLDFSFFVPNLFRQCFVKKNLPIPFVCPSFIINNRNINFIPLLLDKKTIQSFLYFNYSTNIYNQQQIISDTATINNKIATILRTKRSNNYGDYTNPETIFNYIYSSDSLLKQLISFNKALEGGSYNYNNGLIGTNYSIPWAFLVFCSCTNGKFNINSQDVLNKRLLSQLDLLFLNSIKTNKNIYKYYYNTKFITPVENYIISNDIFVILKYALEVYQDVINQINYFMLSKFYCTKAYMRSSNIPKIQKLFNNYVNNQTKVDNNNITESCSDILSNKIQVLLN